jgi:alpha-tubulin suppressor-like RCC1 family protein
MTPCARLPQGQWTLIASLAATMALSACGGGSDSTAANATPSNVPTASLQSVAATPLYWQTDTNVQVSLQDKDGQDVPARTLTCTMQDTAQAVVSADCSLIRPLRVGDISVTVSGKGSNGQVSATLTVKSQPVPHWSGIHGASSSQGSGDYCLTRLGDGRVLAWGANPSGVLGQNKGILDLDFLAQASVVLDADGQLALNGVARVSAGESAAVALTVDGQVKAWGNNDQYALGLKAVLNAALLPVFVPDLSTRANLDHVVQVEMGSQGSVAMKDDGTVVGWGEWQADLFARSASLPTQIVRPDGADLLRDIVAVSAGRTFYLALGAEGKVYAWGNDMALTGNLGSGSVLTMQVKKPVVVKKQDGSELTDIVQISAGYNFSLALDKNGQVWAWGDNSWGEMGQGTQTYLGTPYAVPVKGVGGVSLLSNVTMVVAGGHHALALQADGSVVAWGLATNGQLGDGANRPAGNQAVLPRLVVAETGGISLNGAVSIAAGYTHSQALMKDGRVLSWGHNFRNALGRTTIKSDDPVPGAVLGERGLGTLKLTLSDYPRLTNHWR